MRLLLHVSKHYSLPIFQPLIKYIDDVDEIDYAVFTTGKMREKLALDPVLSNKPHISTLKEGRAYRPDFCLSPSNHIDFRLPGVKVQLFHGLGIEKEAHFKIRHFFDVYLTSGPVVTRRYDSLLKQHRSFLVYETGWLKVDHILGYGGLLKKQELDPKGGKKIILYAPTFSNKMESATDLLPHLPDIIVDDELWIVKFHELMPQSARDLLAKMEGENLRMVSDSDITPYLHAADIMVSDTSSVIYEFMVLDKPAITYRTIKRKDKGIDIENPRDLRPALNRLKINPQQLSESRKKQIAEVNPYLDGKTAERTLEALKDIQATNKINTLKRPLNLGRKAKVVLKTLIR